MIIKDVGFDLRINENLKVNYAENPGKSMMKVIYNCIFFNGIKNWQKKNKNSWIGIFF